MLDCFLLPDHECQGPWKTSLCLSSETLLIDMLICINEGRELRQDSVGELVFGIRSYSWGLRQTAVTAMSPARACLQCLLKLFNFILAILGALMVVYSIWMLNAWGQEDSPSSPPTPSFGFITAQLPNLLAGNLFVADIRQIPAPGPAWFVLKLPFH